MRKSGFTLLELMVVVIIIGILAMIALPQFFKATEKARSAEGINILGSLRSAQFRYYAESDTQVYSSDVADLDMEYGTLRFFENLAALGGAAGGECQPLGTIQRKGGYTLTVYANGTISCSGDVGVACPSGFQACASH